MKEAFRTKLGTNLAGRERLEEVNLIIEEYQAEGYSLTLRQLYYQLVSRGIIPNEQKEYAKLSTLLVKGRMAGLVDWDAIEDRIRVPYLPYCVKDPQDALQDTIGTYRLNRQKGQEVYLELWVEKDALSGILKRVTSEFHIPLVVNRGYSSCSAMYDAFKRFDKAIRKNQTVCLLYLGDHDPSGLDMIRDIKVRITEFLCSWRLTNFLEKKERLEEDIFTIKHLGLTQKQINEFNPPPNPAKISDPRAKWYIEKFGETSWEVDALDPKTLTKLVTLNIQDLIDKDKFHNICQREEYEIEILEKVAEDIR